MLNRATKIMNKQREEREAAADKARAIITDAQEALRVLGFEESSIDKVIDTKPIIINKGHIVTIETTNDEELDRLYEENRRHIRRINELAEASIQLENEIAFKDGQILGLNKQIKELEDKVAELQSTLNAKKLTKVKSIQDELKDYKEELKGGDAVKKCNKLDLLKKVKESEKRKEENMKKDLVKEALKAADEEAQRKAEEKEAAKAQMPKYTIAHDIVTFNKDIVSSTDFGVQGKIALETEEYAFEATNNHHMPIVYGCMSEETVRLVKQIITNEVDRFNFMNELESGAANFTHAQDEEFPLVVWRLTDDKGNINYHAYTDKYVLIWDNNKFKVPARKMIKYALDKDPKHYRKLEQQKNTKKLSDKFIAVCKELYAADFTPDNDPEPTKAVIKITKEENTPISYTDAPKTTIEVDLDGSDEIDL